MATPKNVYELAQERLDVIFREFDTICVSFSGGKDSGVLLNLCIDYIRRNRLNRKLCVFHMDYEIQYSMTIDYPEQQTTRTLPMSGKGNCSSVSALPGS